MSQRLETLKTRLEQYLACELAILGGAQEYSIAGRRMTRANLKEIVDMIRYLEREVVIEEEKMFGGGRTRMFGVIPRDF